MEDRIHLTVATADGTVLDCMTNYVNIPTSFGSLGILRGHAPMLCAVAEGVLKCRIGEDSGVRVCVGEGIADVGGEQVTVLVSFARTME